MTPSFSSHYPPRLGLVTHRIAYVTVFQQHNRRHKRERRGIIAPTSLILVSAWSRQYQKCLAAKNNMPLEAKNGPRRGHLDVEADTADIALVISAFSALWNRLPQQAFRTRRLFPNASCLW